jgi:hypothetical protein
MFNYIMIVAILFVLVTLVARFGNPCAGLAHPVTIAVATTIIGATHPKESHKADTE